MEFPGTVCALGPTSAFGKTSARILFIPVEPLTQVIHLAELDDLMVLQLPHDYAWGNTLLPGELLHFGISVVEPRYETGHRALGYEEVRRPLIRLLLLALSRISDAFPVYEDGLPTVEEQVRAFMEESEPEMVVRKMAKRLLY